MCPKSLVSAIINLSPCPEKSTDQRGGEENKVDNGKNKWIVTHSKLECKSVAKEA